MSAILAPLSLWGRGVGGEGGGDLTSPHPQPLPPKGRGEKDGNHGQRTKPMNPLQSRLAALRRRLRLIVTLRGGCWALAVLIGSLALACLLDRSFYLRTDRDLPSLIRAVLLVGILG